MINDKKRAFWKGFCGSRESLVKWTILLLKMTTIDYFNWNKKSESISIFLSQMLNGNVYLAYEREV